MIGDFSSRSAVPYYISCPGGRTATIKAAIAHPRLFSSHPANYNAAGELVTDPIAGITVYPQLAFENA